MQRCHRSLVFLHGFLGSSEDWEGVMEALPEFECQALDYPFKIPEGVIIVGYSMGGRIALQSSQPKIILSGHPGLQSLEERELRWKEDLSWANRFCNESLEIVLRDWYDMPLFKTLKSRPQFGKILLRRSQQNGAELAEILKKESLAHQTFIAAKNVLFLHGQYDFKYRTLYHHLGLPSLEIPGVGHAAHLEDPKTCARIIAAAVDKLN